MIPFAENFRLNSLRYSCESIHLQEKVMNLSKSNSNINFLVEFESDTFTHCGVNVKNVSFLIDKENERINFYGEIYPLNGDVIHEDIEIVFVFYADNGNISRIEYNSIYSESFYKLDTISDYVPFESMDSLNDFINKVNSVKVYARKR